MSTHALIMRGPVDSGWTQFVESVDTRVVYVSSSSGNDSNDGLSSGAAKATVAAGKALLRDGYPDWLLFKCGDTWSESFGTGGQWCDGTDLGGRSISERMLVSSYGSGARPIFNTGTSDGPSTYHAGVADYVAFVGLHFISDGTDNPNGIAWLTPTDGLIVEDCVFDGYLVNILIQGYPDPGRHSNVSLRRNIIRNARSVNASYSQGIYCHAVDGLLVEENLLDRNGWTSDGDAVWYNHNAYIQNGCTSVVSRSNIIVGCDGYQQRPGGEFSNNLIVGCARGLLFGAGSSPEASGVSGSVTNNVIVDGGNIGAYPYGASQGDGGSGIEMSNLTSATVSGNLVVNNVGGGDCQGITFKVSGGGVNRGCHDTVVSGNVVFGRGGVGAAFEGSAAESDIALDGNVFHNDVDSATVMSFGVSGSASGITSSNNKLWSGSLDQSVWIDNGGASQSFSAWKSSCSDTTSTATNVSFVDSSRTVASYAESIGLSPTTEAFMEQARLQRKGYWRTAFTAAAVNRWIRAGFVEA